MAQKRILCACGTGIATSTVVANKVRQLCKDNGIDATVDTCKVTEAAQRAVAIKADLIVGSTQVPGDTKGIPIVIGMAFLSGLKLPETKEKILEILKK
ncbi:hypothetical protein P22_0998 [Propionispora sp. 2/2-37]|uniref:PTS sugar transporter subunit IIB n=1 Tax=Propionispora sp. 2/2-37 TaxID=1677858 RepID=UPI0006BB7A78|nr:PTS sugar transporter subunit IIB [Propionispora sp. 2/2-37]CUH94929.1 hypothetical protein P22_0998 [Propionispora sp. 2/2-37]